VEIFFTQKGNTLYAVVPGYVPQVKIRKYMPAKSVKVSILGCSKKVSGKQVGKDFVIDLSSLNPGDLATKMFTVRIN
jgi:alpha-L-fucosidase